LKSLGCGDGDVRARGPGASRDSGSDSGTESTGVYCRSSNPFVRLSSSDGGYEVEVVLTNTVSSTVTTVAAAVSIQYVSGNSHHLRAKPQTSGSIPVVVTMFGAVIVVVNSAPGALLNNLPPSRPPRPRWFCCSFPLFLFSPKAWK
jgi:hypothetical protein